MVKKAPTQRPQALDPPGEAPGGEGQDLQMITPEEAAKLLRVSKRQVYRLVERGDIPSLRLGGCIRFDKPTLVGWVHNQMMKGLADNGCTAKRDQVGRRLELPGRARGPAPIPPVPWPDDKAQA